MTVKKNIPNPNKLSALENNFLEDSKHISVPLNPKKPRYKGRMISMSDDFYMDLNNFLKSNPTEGNRSSFIVRIVADYINSKT